MYYYDAENRLTSGMSVAGPSSSVRQVEWKYDAMGRRIRQTLYIYTNDAWQVVDDLKFVSDPELFGRHVAELNATDDGLVRAYVWGLDLAQSLDGAGPVGGLLWVRMNTRPASGTHFVSYDGNGNVWNLVSATSGTGTGHDQYGPFGETLRLSGPVAEENRFLFTAKYQDAETGLLYYGYRYYNASTGRFLSRDPMGDEAFLQGFLSGKIPSEQGRVRERSRQPPYLFVENNPVAHIDPLGLDLAYSGCECCPGIEDAIKRVNNALKTGECKKWFEEHGHDYSPGPPSRDVRCHGKWKIPCILGIPAWTYPGMAIGVCTSKCAEYDAAGLASLLVHELAHHYCTWGPGREDCASTAQDACASALVP